MFDSTRELILDEILNTLVGEHEQINTKTPTAEIKTQKDNKYSDIVVIKATGLNNSDIIIKRIENTLAIDGESKDKYIDAVYKIHTNYELSKTKTVKDIDAKLENGILYLFITYKEKEEHIEQIIKIK